MLFRRARAIALSLLFTVVLYRQALGQQEAAARTDLGPLHATVEVVGQSYCMDQAKYPNRINASAGSIKFDVQLRVQNAGRQNVIVCKTCIWPEMFSELRSVRSDGSVGELRYG